MNERLGAVNGVDEPAVRGVGAGSFTKFFAHNGVLRVSLLNRCADKLFRRAVGNGHRRAIGLVVWMQPC